MIKYFVALLILIGVLVGGFYAFNSYIYNEKQGGVADYKSAIVVIDGKPIAVGTEGTTYFGNDAKGDLNDDGVPDQAYLITQNTGGSGTFFYAVVAFQNAAGNYNGSNAIFLGDRIAPQTSEIRNGVLIVNYADRQRNEPFTTQPSVGVSAYIYFDGVELVSVPPVGPITIRGEMVCLPHKNTEGPQTLECAFGLLDEQGRYFALSDTDPEYKNISSTGMGVRVEVEGTFKLRVQSNYQDIGVIEVTRVTKQ